MELELMIMLICGHFEARLALIVVLILFFLHLDFILIIVIQLANLIINPIIAL